MANANIYDFTDTLNLPQADGTKPMFTRLGNWSYPNKEYFAPGMAP